MTDLGPRRPYSRYAVAAFAVGLIGIPFVPLLGPFLAIRWAKRAEEDIHLRAPYVRGMGLAKLGRLLGYTGLVLTLVWIFVVYQLFYQRVLRSPVSP